jgi:threonine aldolase
MTPVDLRSDTVTRPSADMRAAIAAAEVGDDVYGEDPTVNALEAEVAALFGHEAALFTPTGSMANQVALQLLVPPGDELLCDADAHIVNYEIGAAAALGGISTRTWISSPVGTLDVEAITAQIRTPVTHAVPTRAVAVENTHNRGGGAILPLGALTELRGATAANGAALHCDGARIWNAHVATGTPLASYGALFDTLAVCLSKGLGAPAGSLVVSSAERIARARMLRKRLGGGMRQSGILAAGGRYALEHNLDRLADDHARARRLADALAPYGVVDPARVVTNLVPIDLTKTVRTAPEFVAAAAEHGVLVGVMGEWYARAVTHLDVDDDGIEHAAAVLSRLLS